jgi:hypothetical protein
VDIAKFSVPLGALVSEGKNDANDQFQDCYTTNGTAYLLKCTLHSVITYFFERGESLSVNVCAAGIIDRANLISV